MSATVTRNHDEAEALLVRRRIERGLSVAPNLRAKYAAETIVENQESPMPSGTPDAPPEPQDKPRSWRNVYRVHPAADVFPMLSPAELKELAEDIRVNGLRNPIAVWSDDDDRQFLLDGRNRLEALDLIGSELRSWDVNYLHLKPEAAAAFVVSSNIHRRHLTPADRARLAALALEADRKFRDHRATLHGAPIHTKRVSGSTKSLTGEVAAAAGVSKHVAIEQAEVLHDPELNRKVEAKKLTPQQAGRIVRDRKREQPPIALVSDKRMTMDMAATSCAGTVKVANELRDLRKEIKVRREKAKCRRDQSPWNSDNADKVEMREVLDYIERELDRITDPVLRAGQKGGTQ